MIDRPRRRLIGRALAALASWPFVGLTRALGYPRLMQGPMLGAPGPTHLAIWARASGALPLEVEYARQRDLRDARRTAVVQVDASTDFTTVIRIENLTPDTRYYYRVLVDGIVDRYQPLPYEARTAVAGPGPLRVAFGSCARYTHDRDQRVFDGVMRQAPDLFLWLGDNIYADTESPLAIAEEYRRQRNVERMQALIHSVPQLAIWDDHDFGHNNSDGTSPYKQASLEVFRRYWANPAFGLADDPGVYFEHSQAGVDFFCLDGRYHRSPNAAPQGGDKTLLGAHQKAWLKERLLASRAPFKVIACGSGWSAADGSDGDTWAAFLTERNEIFEFITERRIEGVVLLSGDSHVGELNCIPWSDHGGYDLYDLVSSPLAQGTSDTWATQRPEVRLREVFVKGPNFGLLEFRYEPEPTLIFTLHDVTGASVWQPLTLAARELRNGVSTWRAKIDPGLTVARGAAVRAPRRSRPMTPA